jgi:hypothetical protein
MVPPAEVQLDLDARSQEGVGAMLEHAPASAGCIGWNVGELIAAAVRRRTARPTSSAANKAAGRQSR